MWSKCRAKDHGGMRGLNLKVMWVLALHLQEPESGRLLKFCTPDASFTLPRSLPGEKRWLVCTSIKIYHTLAVGHSGLQNKESNAQMAPWMESSPSPVCSPMYCPAGIPGL